MLIQNFQIPAAKVIDKLIKSLFFNNYLCDIESYMQPPFKIIVIGNNLINMDKIYSWVVLGLFLVLVPLGSWYYLNQGLQYRKELIKEIQIKTEIAKDSDSLQLLYGSSNLVVLQKSKDILEIVNQLNEQFKNSPRFNIVFKDSVDGYPFLPIGYMSNEWNELNSGTFILLDTLMNVRNTYTAESDQIKKLVEHITMVIPRQIEPDIKVKSN